jgi:hypothetical protein
VRQPLVSFFVLTYGVTWLLWSPVVIWGLPVFSATTHAPSWYLMPGVAVGMTGSVIGSAVVLHRWAGPPAEERGPAQRPAATKGRSWPEKGNSSRQDVIAVARTSVSGISPGRGRDFLSD